MIITIIFCIMLHFVLGMTAITVAPYRVIRSVRKTILGVMCGPLFMMWVFYDRFKSAVQDQIDNER